MKLSKYVHIVNDNENYLIFNVINGKIIKINSVVLDFILNKKWERLDVSLITYLIKNLFLVENDRFCLNDYSDRISININITNKCNFRCEYCYFSKSNNFNRKKYNFNLDDFKFWYKQIINNNYKCKYVDVIFMGGEPLLAFNKILKVIDIVKELSVNKIFNFELITNGYFLNSYIINKLIENKFTNIQVTIDGDRIQHNSMRRHLGKYDSYDLLLKNIEKAADFIKVIIRVNFSDKIKYDSIRNMLIDLKKIRVSFLYFSHIEHNMCINKMSYNKSIIDNYKKLWKLQVSFGFELFQILPSVVTNCIAKNINGYTINYDGKLYMCPISCGNDKYLEGNINNVYFKKKYIGYNTIKRYEQLCSECNLFPICFGGCPYEIDYKSLNCNKRFISNVIDEYIKIKYF